MTRAALTAVLVVGSQLGAVTAAQAAAAAPAAVGPLVAPAKPFDCSTVRDDNRNARAICRNGGGEHRIVVRCDVNNWPDYTRYGEWKPNGQWSEAGCFTDAVIKSTTRETRQWT